VIGFMAGGTAGGKGSRREWVLQLRRVVGNEGDVYG